MGQIHAGHLPVHHHLGLCGRSIEVAVVQVILDGFAEPAEGEEGEGDLGEVCGHEDPKELADAELDTCDLERIESAQQDADPAGDQQCDTAEQQQHEKVREETHQHRGLRLPSLHAVVDGVEDVAHPPERMIPVRRVPEAAVDDKCQHGY